MSLALTTRLTSDAMNGNYLGHLTHGDPMYHYIEEQIAPQLGIKSVFISSNQGGKQTEGAKPD